MAFRDVVPDSVKQHVRAGIVMFAVIVMLCGVGLTWPAFTLPEYVAAGVVLFIAMGLFWAARAIDAAETDHDLDALAKHFNGWSTPAKGADGERNQK